MTARGIMILAAAACLTFIPSRIRAQSIPYPAPLPSAAHTIVYDSVSPTAVQPAIINGDPSKPDFPTPFTSIDPNSPDSPLAGVVSIYGAANSVTGVLGSGVAIDPYHILTAAHVVDFSGGINSSGNSTGDGTPDALLAYSRVYLNNIAAPNPLTIASIQVAPAWHGFDNILSPTGPSTHNDLAIITLANPLPASVPTYPIYTTPFANDNAKLILMSGYGGGGNAIAGLTQPASFDIKHYGWNITALYEAGETPATANTAEVFLADFDPSDAGGQPDITHTGLDGYTSLGNDFESTISPGDSGGPAFLADDLNNDGFIEPNELSVFGLDTFTLDTGTATWPSYGSAFGGTILSAYLGFIDSATGLPEPSTLGLLAFSSLLLTRRRK